MFLFPLALTLLGYPTATLLPENHGGIEFSYPLHLQNLPMWLNAALPRGRGQELPSAVNQNKDRNEGRVRGALPAGSNATQSELLMAYGTAWVVTDCPLEVSLATSCDAACSQASQRTLTCYGRGSVGPPLPPASVEGEMALDPPSETVCECLADAQAIFPTLRFLGSLHQNARECERI